MFIGVEVEIWDALVSFVLIMSKIKYFIKIIFVFFPIKFVQNSRKGELKSRTTAILFEIIDNKYNQYIDKNGSYCLIQKNMWYNKNIIGRIHHIFAKIII